MGLLDFVKDAGKKLGFGDDEPETTEAAPAAPAAPSPEEVKRVRDRRVGMGLVKLVQGMGFEVDELSIRVDDDTATISGKVADQGTAEKVVLAVGNTAGIARVDNRLEVAEAEAEATFHTVVSGDTLSGIAKTYYGNPMKYPVIFEANQPMLTDPNKIYPGQVLRIPPLES